MTRTTHQNKKQTGLTILEVAVVIAVLGLVSGMALPKINSYQSSHRISKLMDVRGSVAAAAAMTHSLAVAQSKLGTKQACTANGKLAALSKEGHGTLCTELHTLVAFAHAYPAASSEGIVAAAEIDLRENEVLVVGNSVTIRLADSPSPESCQFTYTAATATHSIPVLSAANTSGC
ncbi:type II secretion system protein [Aquabacterium sp.]|uniref:type II secretion system protein n=1 Tax=Aquabacterium sp. TaxID=1872578 RepID=UPI002488762A|nr:type II secretion system protein [Aquabacterium sp.]MDI1259093.1 type II secretion system protein [Aquabacterium sp.]